jgi:hypothetical protein
MVGAGSDGVLSAMQTSSSMQHAPIADVALFDRWCGDRWVFIIDDDRIRAAPSAEAALSWRLPSAVDS